MKNRIVADIHTHTLASGHAYGTIREMAQAASERKLALLGISEHGPGIPGTVHPIYFHNLSVAPKELYGVQIIHGCEINMLKDGELSLGERYMERLDYAIVGVHQLCYQNQGIKINTDNLIKCMQHSKISFVSHPDDGEIPFDYERLVAAAKEYHVALELNNSSLRKKDHRLNCVENLKTMLGLCMEMRAPIIVNTDAHDPLAVGDFTLAEAFLDEIGFDESLVLNTSAEAVKQFISEGKASGFI
ncbi:MAG: phosphatase [Blautia sp.]|nr:phosphatase [Blautia sp.]